MDVSGPGNGSCFLPVTLAISPIRSPKRLLSLLTLGKATEPLTSAPRMDEGHTPPIWLSFFFRLGEAGETPDLLHRGAAAVDAGAPLLLPPEGGPVRRRDFAACNEERVGGASNRSRVCVTPPHRNVKKVRMAFALKPKTLVAF